MGKKRKNTPKYLSRSVADKPKNTTLLNEKDLLHLNLVENSDGLATAHLNLRYYDKDFQCFSELDKNDLKNFSSFTVKLTQTTWADIYKSGGKSGSKKGFGYTKHKDISQLPNQDLIAKLSEDLTYFELRLGGEARVHGFRVKNAFCLLWLDRNHEVYPS